MRIFATCVMATMLVASSMLSSAGARVSGSPVEGFSWETFTVPDFGTQVEYPAGIFVDYEGPAEKGIGERLRSADGRALLTIYSRANQAADTPASYLKSNLRLARSALDYERVTRSFFAISSSRQGLIFYSRCNFSSNAGGALHCFDLVYPEREKRAWDMIVTRISRSLRPLEAQGM